MIKRQLSTLLRPIREKKVTSEFKARGIRVKELGTKPRSGMVLLTHPTIEDTKITRHTLKDSFTLVTADELKWHKSDRANKMRAQIVGAMIPVYKGSKEKRQITYTAGASVLNSGNLLTIAPTGRTTFSSELPKPEELTLGGIIKILRASKKNNTFVTPAVRFVNQEDITPEGLIKNGSTVYMIYGDPIPVPQSFLSQEEVPETDIQSFSKQVYFSWQSSLSYNKIPQKNFSVN